MGTAGSRRLFPTEGRAVAREVVVVECADPADGTASVRYLEPYQDRRRTGPSEKAVGEWLLWRDHCAAGGKLASQEAAEGCRFGFLSLRFRWKTRA